MNIISKSTTKSIRLVINREPNSIIIWLKFVKFAPLFKMKTNFVPTNWCNFLPKQNQKWTNIFSHKLHLHPLHDDMPLKRNPIARRSEEHCPKRQWEYWEDGCLLISIILILRMMRRLVVCVCWINLIERCNDHNNKNNTLQQSLANQTGLQVAQVNYWFINARVRIWRPMMGKGKQYTHDKSKITFELTRWVETERCMIEF